MKRSKRRSTTREPWSNTALYVCREQIFFVTERYSARHVENRMTFTMGLTDNSLYSNIFDNILKGSLPIQWQCLNVNAF